MFRRFAPFTVALLAAACGSEPPRASKGQPLARAEQGRAAEQAVTSLEEIAGSWDIVRFGDYRPTRLGSGGLRRAYVRIRADGLAYTIECNYSGNPARIDGRGVLLDLDNGSRMSTCMGCGGDREARDEAFFGFFATRPRVTRAEDGRLRLSNGRTELILERPEARRLANVPPLGEIEGRWVPGMASRVFEHGGNEGYGFQEPGILTITANRLRYSGCGGVTVDFRYTQDARMVVTTGPVQAARCSDDQAAAALLRVIGAGPEVERTAGGGIALSANGEVVSLQSEKELRRQRETPLPPPPAGSSPPPPPPPPPPPAGR